MTTYQHIDSNDEWIVDDFGNMVGVRARIDGVASADKNFVFGERNPVTGGIEKVTVAGRRITSITPKRGSRSPIPYIGEEMKISDFTLAAGAGVSLSIVTIAGGRKALKVDVPAGAITASIEFPNMANTVFNGEMFVQIIGTRQDQFDGVTMFVSSDNYANFVSSVKSFPSSVANSPIEQGDAHTIRYGKEDWSVTGAVTYPLVTQKVKLNINPVSSSAYTVYLLGVGFGPKLPTGRISVVVDDGYASWFKLGQPLADDRGIPVTHAIIPAFIDAQANGSVTLSSLKALVNNGGAVIAHGPNFVDGYINGNLFTRYSDTASRMADITGVIDWISANGLATPNFEKCYVYPQGAYQSAFRDFDLLDAMLNVGITTARTAAGYQALAPRNFDAASKYQHLCLPIIGHTFAGTTATEVTNISNVVSRINAAATNGQDICLMFHGAKVTATADGSMLGTDIRVSDLTTILDAIKTAIDAGTLKAVLFTEFATDRSGNFWQQ